METLSTLSPDRGKNCWFPGLCIMVVWSGLCTDCLGIHSSAAESQERCAATTSLEEIDGGDWKIVRDEPEDVHASESICYGAAYCGERHRGNHYVRDVFNAVY